MYPGVVLETDGRHTVFATQEEARRLRVDNNIAAADGAQRVMVVVCWEGADYFFLRGGLL